MRSQLNRGRRLISAFVPALAWWRASRARMFHSWRHRSGLSNEAAILIPRFGGSNPPAAASLYASARHTHHISGEQSFTPTSAGFGNRVLVGDPLHNSARNGSTAGKITGTKDAHGQCFVEPAELHRVYPAVADAAGNAAATPHLAMDDAAALAMAQQRAAMAEEKLGELKTLLNDMRKDRDAWRDQAQGRLHPRLDVCDLRDRRADVRSWSSPFAAKHTNSSIATPKRVRIRRGSYTSGLMLIEQYACGPFGLSVSVNLGRRSGT